MSVHGVDVTMAYTSKGLGRVRFYTPLLFTNITTNFVKTPSWDAEATTETHSLQQSQGYKSFSLFQAVQVIRTLEKECLHLLRNIRPLQYALTAYCAKSQATATTPNNTRLLQHFPSNSSFNVHHT